MDRRKLSEVYALAMGKTHLTIIGFNSLSFFQGHCYPEKNLLAEDWKRLNQGKFPRFFFFFEETMRNWYETQWIFVILVVDLCDFSEMVKIWAVLLQSAGEGLHIRIAILAHGKHGMGGFLQLHLI